MVCHWVGDHHQPEGGPRADTAAGPGRQDHSGLLKVRIDNCVQGGQWWTPSHQEQRSVGAGGRGQLRLQCCGDTKPTFFTLIDKQIFDWIEANMDGNLARRP